MIGKADSKFYLKHRGAPQPAQERTVKQDGSIVMTEEGGVYSVRNSREALPFIRTRKYAEAENTFNALRGA